MMGCLLEIFEKHPEATKFLFDGRGKDGFLPQFFKTTYELTLTIIYSNRDNSFEYLVLRFLNILPSM